MTSALSPAFAATAIDLQTHLGSDEIHPPDLVPALQQRPEPQAQAGIARCEQRLGAEAALVGHGERARAHGETRPERELERTLEPKLAPGAREELALDRRTIIIGVDEQAHSQSRCEQQSDDGAENEQGELECSAGHIANLDATLELDATWRGTPDVSSAGLSYPSAR